MTDKNNNNKSDDSSAKKTNEEHDSSRRSFIKNTGMVIGGIAGGSILGGVLTNQFQTEQSSEGDRDNSLDNYREARMFFKREEDFKVLEAAVERIFPEDDNGPGAIKLRVPYFIDSQLAGEFGSNRRDYMQGPRQKVKNVDTYQTLMTRGEVFLEGLRSMNMESKNKYELSFFDIENDEQDSILEDIENNEIELDGVSPDTFFNLLKQMTLEGAYSDPLYGGNKDMKGWEMREYPGARSSYADLIESEEFQSLDPVNLKDYQP